MSHGQPDIGQIGEISKTQFKGNEMLSEDFVLEKSIFNNIFEKDIRRVYIYKKAERLAKAIHLITPAFVNSSPLRNRIDAIAIGLIDAAIVPHGAAREALSRELLALSSILSVARTGGMLSHMNVDLITREAHILLQEIAAYEEPRLFFDETLTLSDLAKRALSRDVRENETRTTKARATPTFTAGAPSGTYDKRHKKEITHVTDIHIKDRREAVLSVIKNKGTVSIKDISTHIRGVSEKTIQRELSSLINEGLVSKRGQRRWSTYSIS